MALKRIVALLLALADVAEAACSRSRFVRWAVLWFLGTAEAVACDYVEALTGIPASSQPVDDTPEGNDGYCQGIGEAMRLAFVFRTLAALLAALPDDVAVPLPLSDRSVAGFASALRRLIVVPIDEAHDTS